MVGGAGHASLVDRERNDRGAVLPTERQDGVAALASALEVDRVHDRPPGIVLEGGLRDVGLGRIDDQRRFDGRAQAFDDLAHLVELVAPLSQRHTDVEQVGATLDLVAGDVEHAVVVVS